jgi:hypothetical protein
MIQLPQQAFTSQYRRKNNNNNKVILTLGRKICMRFLFFIFFIFHLGTKDLYGLLIPTLHSFICFSQEIYFFIFIFCNIWKGYDLFKSLRGSATDTNGITDT